MSKYINTVIITDRLILGSYDIKDLSEVANVLNNKYICKNIGAKPVYDIERVKEFIRNNAVTFKSKECSSTRVAVRLKNKEFIGNIGVYKREDYIELGWWLIEKYRHKGYMSEALKQIIKHLKVLDEDLKIKANIFKFNIESQKLAEKIGMQLIEVHNDSNEYMVYKI